MTCLKLFVLNVWCAGFFQEPQFPNSVVEFTFDGSQCVGMKRKLSSPSSSPPLTPSSAQQVVPRNISIYYFKHSDTEPEPHHSQHQQTNSKNRGNRHQSTSSAKSPPQNRRVSGRSHCEKSASRHNHECNLASTSGTTSCSCTSATSGGAGSGSVNINRKGAANRHHHACQKSSLFLELDQEFEDDITSLKSYDEISFGSFDLDLDEDLEDEAGAADDTVATPSSSSSSAGGGGEQDQLAEVNLHHHKLDISAEDGEEDQPYSLMDLEGNVCLPQESTVDHISFNNENHNRRKSRASSTAGANNNPVNSNIITNKPVVRLDEIEELVQQAELLVQQKTRSQGFECVDLPVEVVGSSDDDEGEEDDERTLMLPQKQKQSGDQHHHHAHHFYHHHHHQHNHHQHYLQQQQQLSDIMMIASQTSSSAPLTNMNGNTNTAPVGSRCCGIDDEIGKATNISSNGHGSQELLHSPPQQKLTGFHAYHRSHSHSTSSSVRKCSVSSGVSSSSFASAHQSHHQNKHSKSANANKTPSIGHSLSAWSTSVLSGGGAGAPPVDNCGFLQQLKAFKSAGSNNTFNYAMSSGNNESPKGVMSIVETPVQNVSCGVGETGGGVSKTSKKNARIRQWIRAHNSEIVVNQKVSKQMKIPFSY